MSVRSAVAFSSGVVLFTALLAPIVYSQSGTATATEVAIDGEPTGVTQEQVRGMSFTCRPADLPPDEARVCRVARLLEGQRLFDQETFGGNGRTCNTCHPREKGTLSPEDVQARLAADPNDPLFRHDGLDDGRAGTSRITSHATVRVELELPPYVTLKDDPVRRTIVVHRAIPTTMNTPALDKVLMQDLRNRTLEEQALGAIVNHAMNTVAPTPLQLELIAEYERESPRFFSSPALRAYAKGGPAPELPAGNTESERRGRAFFIEAPFTKGGKDGLCALCHAGPMLNTASPLIAQAVPGAPPGFRDVTILVSERNLLKNPVYTFLVETGRAQTVEVSTPDPGEVLVERNMPPPSIFPRTLFVNFFKVPTLWGVKNTPPYFHDGSAKTLEDVVEQYEFFFKDNPFGLTTVLSEQDKADIVAYMKLLD